MVFGLDELFDVWVVDDIFDVVFAIRMSFCCWMMLIVKQIFFRCSYDERSSQTSTSRK